MMFWEIIWAAVIIFSVLSFSYMSVKIVILGFPELKEMFTALSNEQIHNNDGNETI